MFDRLAQKFPLQWSGRNDRPMMYWFRGWQMCGSSRSLTGTGFLLIVTKRYKKYKGYGKPRDSSETDLRVFHCLMWQRCAEILEVETMMWSPFVPPTWFQKPLESEAMILEKDPRSCFYRKKSSRVWPAMALVKEISCEKMFKGIVQKALDTFGVFQAV